VKLAAAILLAAALLPGAAFALATLETPYALRNLDDPNPPVLLWHSSIAHYNGGIIYSGRDGKIYSMNIGDGTSTLVCDTSSLSSAWSAPYGFAVVRGDHLYFHDNGINPARIYRLDLSGAWPKAIGNVESLDTGALGSIFSIAQNPFTGTIWFTSGDFATGMLYLYEVSKAFDAATQKAAFAAPNGGGIGPVVFQAPQVALVGEAFFGANGYFHLVNTATGAVTIQNFMTFEGGLAAAINGYGNAIYAVSGDGNRLYRIEENRKIFIQTLPGEGAWGLAFDGDELFVANMDGLDFVAGGAVTFLALDGGSQLVAEVNLPDAAPAPEDWNASIGYYNERLIYAADDRNVYAYNIRTGASTLVLNADALAGQWAAVSGFLVSGNYLYFHDNDFPAQKIYRANLASQWPIANIDELDTGADGSIFSFAINPWAAAGEDRLWFASGDFWTGRLYLYSVANDFSGVTKVSDFAAPNAGAVAPIIFMGPSRLLYGESVFGGNGFFHIVDTSTGNIELADYFTFPDGLSAAVHGRFFSIYAASGDGGTVYHLAADTAAPVVHAPVVQLVQYGIRGLVFDGIRLFLGITDVNGKPYFARAGADLAPLRQAVNKDMGTSDSSTCFVGAVSAEGASANNLLAGLVVLLA
ncbi:MAG: hypothetical protein QMD09_14580, partial [Desulfatibacillaceae bacterium]|nr:hypothetical protein [Desulfatibacillaceae bacterium]